VGPQERHREADMVLSVQKVGPAKVLTVGHFEVFHTSVEQHPALEEMPDLAESRLLGTSPA
jgi:hypothetical protein